MSNIRIDELPATSNPHVEHEFAAMRGGGTVKLSVGQVSQIAQDVVVGGASTEYDTLGKVETIVSGINSASGLGQCRFNYVSSTECVLDMFGGNLLPINGELVDIPSSGVTLNNSGIGAFTTYNIFAFLNVSDAVELEASVTGRESDTTVVGNEGVEIKAGDSTRTLVGKVHTGSLNQFTDDLSISWFNRQPKLITVFDTVSRSTTSSSYIEFNPSIRANFLSWGEPHILGGIIGRSRNSVIASSNNLILTLNNDETKIVTEKSWQQPQANYNVDANGFGAYLGAIPEGINYLSLKGKCNGGTISVFGNLSPDFRGFQVITNG